MTNTILYWLGLMTITEHHRRMRAQIEQILKRHKEVEDEYLNRIRTLEADYGTED